MWFGFCGTMERSGSHKSRTTLRSGELGVRPYIRKHMKEKVIISIAIAIVLFLSYALLIITTYSYFPTTVITSTSPDVKYKAEVKYRVHPLAIDWVDPKSIVYFYVYDKNE